MSRDCKQAISEETNIYRKQRAKFCVTANSEDEIRNVIKWQ
jgi:hypothetical protein